MLTGEKPEVNAEVARRLEEYGHADFTSYVVWVCERALERGLLPHTNLGVLGREDLARLREVTASQGLMLESVSERLMETVHAGSPTKHPARRIETIAAAGELQDPVHERDPRRDRRDRGRADRVARRARRAARAPWPHPGGDPPELRAAPELLRPRARADRRRRRERVLAHRALGRPASGRAGMGVRGHGRGHEAAGRRGAAVDAGRRDPGPAEPVGLVGRAGRAPAPPTSAGSAPTATTSRPSTRSRRRPRSASGCAPRASALSERLCVYPEYIDPEWISRPVMDVIKARATGRSSRAGARAGGVELDVADDAAPRAVARARDGLALTPRS